MWLGGQGLALLPLECFVSKKNGVAVFALLIESAHWSFSGHMRCNRGPLVRGFSVCTRVLGRAKLFNLMKSGLLIFFFYRVHAFSVLFKKSLSR